MGVSTNRRCAIAACRVREAMGYVPLSLCSVGTLLTRIQQTPQLVTTVNSGGRSVLSAHIGSSTAQVMGRSWNSKRMFFVSGINLYYFFVLNLNTRDCKLGYYPTYICEGPNLSYFWHGHMPHLSVTVINLISFILHFHPFIHSFIHSFIHAYIHSFPDWSKTGRRLPGPSLFPNP